MKIKLNGPHFDTISAAIDKVIVASGGVEALRARYRNYPRCRMLWDVLWATNENINYLYDSGCNDNHIETMLKRICLKNGLLDNNRVSDRPESLTYAGSMG